MSTWITIEVEVGVDVPQDALGMWIAQQLNYPSVMAVRPKSAVTEDLADNHQHVTAERSEEEEAALAALDEYQGPVTVMWWDPQPERSRA